MAIDAHAGKVHQKGHDLMKSHARHGLSEFVEHEDDGHAEERQDEHEIEKVLHGSPFALALLEVQRAQACAAPPRLIRI